MGVRGGGLGAGVSKYGRDPLCVANMLERTKTDVHPTLNLCYCRRCNSAWKLEVMLSVVLPLQHHPGLSTSFGAVHWYMVYTWNGATQRGKRAVEYALNLVSRIEKRGMLCFVPRSGFSCIGPGLPMINGSFHSPLRDFITEGEKQEP